MQYRFVAILSVLAIVLQSACAGAQPADAQAHPLAGQAIALPQALPDGAVDLPRFPSISPDGSAVCFSWRGDLWRVPTTGGQATRLTVHAMDEELSAWSPDGKAIAFNSTRSGYRNVYRMNADGTGVTAVTREDQSHFVSGWADEQTITVSAWREADVHKNPRPYAVDAAGGPVTRLHDAFGRSPAVSPDGRHVAFVRGRARWSQPFLTNSDNRDIWLYDTKNETFRRLTSNPGNDGLPKWIDNETIAYLSARPPARVNLYHLNIQEDESKAVALTAFEEDDVQHFDLAREAGSAVLHVWDTLYSLDLAGADGKPKPIAITAPADRGDQTIVQSLRNSANDAVLSPDGKVMAISMRGELFVRTLDSENPAQRITRHAALDHQPAWSPDGQTLYFTSDRDGTLSIYQANVTLTRSEIESALRDEPAEESVVEEESQEQAEAEAETQSPDEETQDGDAADAEAESDASSEPDKKQSDPVNRWHDAMRFEVMPVVQKESHDAGPSPSPDGKTLAFRRGNGTLMLLDLVSGEERVYLDQWDAGLQWAWSGDSRYLAVSYQDQDHNADIWVGPADGSAEPVNITKHPAMDRLPSFSLDSKVLTFVSSRAGDQYDVYAVYLDKSLESMTAQQLADYYDEAKKRAKQRKPLPAPVDAAASEDGEAEPAEDAKTKGDETAAQLDLDDAYLRLRRLTDTPESEWGAVVHPGGHAVAYTREDAAYRVQWDGKDEKKLSGDFDLQHLSLAGDKLVGLQGRTAAVLPIGGGEATTVNVNGNLRVDRQDLWRQRFVEASRALTMSFYDGSFKGIDWPGATAKYAELASRAWTPSEFDDVANRYLGLLSASHMGIRSPKLVAENSQSNGRLGASYQRVADGYEVASIEPNTPAERGPMRLVVGDVITAIDFVPIQAIDTVASRLVGRVGKETAVTVHRLAEGADEAESIHLLLTPISFRAFEDIRYDNWQAENRARVAELSEGRLGYIHIESMNESSLAEYERDLYAACEGKDGLIIDVRDNGGGWTTDRLLASIMTERHAYTVPRGADPNRTNSYPISRLFIARYNLPMNALCNENSFSNAEIFSHAFKTLGRGTLVGNTTAGGVISTGMTRLLDGTTVRLPFRGWFLPDGTDMENNGAVPDLLLPQLPSDEAAGNDAQLDAAVKDLLKRL